MLHPFCAELRDDEFRKFAEQRYSPEGGEEYLSQYLDEWMQEQGISCTGADFTLYLLTIIFIVDAWLKDPTFFDYKGNEGSGPRSRRLAGFINPEDSRMMFLDPYFFRTLALERHLKKR